MGTDPANRIDEKEAVRNDDMHEGGDWEDPREKKFGREYRPYD